MLQKSLARLKPVHEASGRGPTGSFRGSHIGVVREQNIFPTGQCSLRFVSIPTECDSPEPRCSFVVSLSLFHGFLQNQMLRFNPFLLHRDYAT